jgi:putative phage-type endonuclease
VTSTTSAPVVVLPAGADRETWLQARTLGIGGSEVAAACGLSPFVTPYSLWLEKTGRLERDGQYDAQREERFRWGHVIEPLILREFDERNPEYIMTGGEGLYSDPDRTWRLANVDSLAWNPDQSLAAVVEVKTVSGHQVRYWAHDWIPIHYVCQVQWYLSVLGAPRGYIAALLDTSTYVQRSVERDDELINDLTEGAEEFWGHVLRDTPPPADPSETTRRALSRARAIEGETIELDQEWNKHLDHREELAEQIGRLEIARAEIDNRLRAAMGTAEVAMIGGQRVASHRAPSRPSRTCDWDRFAAEQPDLYLSLVTERQSSRRLVYATRSGSTNERSEH